MATSYNIKCINSTDKSYFFAVYQTFPNSPGLRSVAWEIRGVPPKGQLPSTSDIDWTLIYGVSIASWDRNGQTYTGQQIVDAEIGNTYHVEMTEGVIPAIDPIPKGNFTPGLIKFKNNTSQVLDMGFTINGSLVAVQSVSGGETINFDVHPSYYVACYRSIQRGQLVDSGIEIGPVKVEYPMGYTKCEVEATVVGGMYTLKDAHYVSRYKAFAHPELDAAAQASVVTVVQQRK